MIARLDPVWLCGIGVLGAGFPDWQSAREVMLGSRPYADAPDPQPVPALLPANERRRASVPARWALTVGSEALSASAMAPSEVATVFTSCCGDGTITDQICRGLAATPPEMSPTRFHNSVHNAPAGYWSIFARSMAPSTSLSGFDASFGAGLLEAATQVIAEKRPVLLVAYDLPSTEPLHGLWPVKRPFAAALLLAPSQQNPESVPLRVSIEKGSADQAWPVLLPPDLADNPAAQALRLLAASVRSEGAVAQLAYLDGSRVVVETGFRALGG